MIIRLPAGVCQATTCYISLEIDFKNQSNLNYRPTHELLRIRKQNECATADALTYASLAPVASLNGNKRATDRTSQSVIAVLNRAGVIKDGPARADNVKLARYELVTGHNIPDVFWTFMNQSGPVYSGRFHTYSEGQILNWLEDLGYPITEPYWTNVKVAGAQ